VCAGAQEVRTSTLKGRLHADDRAVILGYVIEMEESRSHGEIVRADVESGGDFTFRQLPFGDYVLRITTYQGEPVAQQFVTIQERMAVLDIQLPRRPATPTGGTVSLSQLRHPPAAKALAAFAAAQRFAESGHYDRAAEELQKAASISPEFAPAHANLGVQYLRMRRFDDARAEIERALSLGGPNPRDLSNLSFAFAALQRVPEAIEAARAALRLDRQNAPAHYLLGSMLVMSPETRGEGVAHLEVAAKSMQSARQALEALERR
jgi:tetratricopeptide (TPR) repeat protein